jgi:tetratricopeptide (TPR) repeat protein
MYRPNDVDAGRDGQPHPLKKALTEIKIHSDKVWLDLNAATQQSGRTFVDAFIDTEPNNLDESFRVALFARTTGHALFTVELLRDLQERGALAQDSQGRWQIANEIDWNDLPDRVEGVIEERIGRLEESLRELLSVASVEGQDFTAQVLGKIQELREKDLLKSLSQQLANHHRLVQETGERRVGRTILFRYAFSHALFHQYFYNLLGRGEKRVLHGEVAAALEMLYEGRTDEIAAQLARHFEESGDIEKSVRYLLVLLGKARRTGSLTDTILIGEKALTLIETDDTQPAAILTDKVEILFLTARAYKYTGEATKAKTYIDHGLAIADQIRNADLAVRGLFELADILRLENDLENAAINIYRAVEKLSDLADRTIEVAVWRLVGAIERARTGNAEVGLQYVEKSIEIARTLDDKLGITDGLNSLAIALRRLGKLEESKTCYEEGLAIASERNDEYNQSVLLSNLSIVYRDIGDLDTATAMISRAKQVTRKIGSNSGWIHRLVEHSIIYMLSGHYQEATNDLMEVLDILQNINRPPTFKEALQTGTMLALIKGDVDEAIDYIIKAQEIDIVDANHRASALYGIALSLKQAIVEAQLAYDKALEQAEALLKTSPSLFEAKYSRGIAFTGLAVISTGDQQKAYLGKAVTAFEEALSNCPHAGARKFFGWLRLELLRPVDVHGILTPIIAMLKDDVK